MDLFDYGAAKDRRGAAPLAERARPLSLDDVLGQGHLVGPGKVLRTAIEADRLPSMVLWGPPGSGKTTLARIVARSTGAEFEAMSAVVAGVKDVRKVVSDAKERWKYHRRRTILFLDEIHRFNKAQQDALLPYVEDGTVTLIGATTENPSFEVNAALLSRTRVFRLHPLTEEDLQAVMRSALAVETAARGIEVEAEALESLAAGSYGDARRALNGLEAALEYAAQSGTTTVTPELASEASARRVLLYDRSGEEHYNVISAFIKSMRGMDPDAAAYWCVRMLESGEDPRFVARRMVIFASEDVGNADPEALKVAVAAFQALQLVGLPEAMFALVQAAIYLACAPKSNSALRALAAARRAVRERGPLPVPLRHRNATTGLQRADGYGKGYRYPHDFAGAYAADDHLPEALAGTVIYEPSDQGYEAEIANRLAAARANGRGGEGEGAG